MPGVGIGTGWQATHAVVTDLDAAAITNITRDGVEVPVIDVSKLSSTVWREKLVGDLAEPGSVAFDLLMDASVEFVPGDATKGVLTITARQLEGETAPANWAGNAWLMSESSVVPLEDVVTQNLVFAWETGPTHTPATVV